MGIPCQTRHDRHQYGSGNQAPPKLIQENQDEKQERTEDRQSSPRTAKRRSPPHRQRKTEKPEAEPKRTIKQVVIETIAANSVATNDEMIAAVKAEFPKSAFKDTHAAWYRSQARKGLLTGTPIAIPAMGRKQSKASN